MEIANIVNDWRSQAVGGMETAIILWEALCIPSLLNGAGTWTEISAATEKKLEQLQQWFLRLGLLGLGNWRHEHETPHLEGKAYVGDAHQAAG